MARIVCNLLVVVGAAPAESAEVDVKVGDVVQPGAELGKVGTTGYSTGPHLHFEVRRDGVPIDPAPFLPLNRSGPRTMR